MSGGCTAGARRVTVQAYGPGGVGRCVVEVTTLESTPPHRPRPGSDEGLKRSP